MASDIDKNIDKFINKTLGKAVNRGIELVCQTIENQAKKNCPVDDGPLMADIQHEVDEGKHEGVVGNTLEYAGYRHEGTGIYAVGGNGRQTPWVYKSADGKFYTTAGMKPKPYLRDAIDENRGLILKTLGEGAGTEWKI